jgi:hypothetical protein
LGSGALVHRERVARWAAACPGNWAMCLVVSLAAGTHFAGDRHCRATRPKVPAAGGAGGI